MENKIGNGGEEVNGNIWSFDALKKYSFLAKARMHLR